MDYMKIDVENKRSALHLVLAGKSQEGVPSDVTQQPALVEVCQSSNKKQLQSEAQ